MTTPAVAKALDDALERLMTDEATLATRLARYADILRDLNRPFAEAVDRMIERLAAVEAGSSAPMPGDTMPPFLLPDDAGRLVGCDDLVARGPLVVAFRRGHWCPYCQLATEALARIQHVAAERGASLVVITPETGAFARRLKARAGAAFPLLTDVDNGYAMSLGLAIAVGEEMRHFMTARGRDLAAYQGNGAWMLPIPATFVLDSSGRIVMRHVDPDYRRRAAVEDVLDALARLRP